MALGGEKRVASKKKIGIAEFKVIAINPDKEELEKLYSTEIEKEPVYVKEKEGVTNVEIYVYLEEVKTKGIFKHVIFLADKEVLDKTKTKTQYINSIGRQSWVDDESNLQEKFTAYPYHAARGGEADLIDFLSAWLEIDRTKPYNLEVDWAKLMDGNMKELTDLLNSDLPRNVVGVGTVRIVDKDGDINEYQGLYRKLLPDYTMKYFRTKKFDFTEEYIEALRAQKRTAKETNKWLKPYEDFIVSITDKEHGCKDIYTLRELTDYVPGEALVDTNKVIDESGADY